MTSVFQTKFDTKVMPGMNRLFAINDGTGDGTDVDAVYRRGADSASFDMLMKASTSQSIDRGGFVTEKRHVSFSFDHADLVLGGSEVLPARGDTIEFAVGGVTHTYAVDTNDGTAIFAWNLAHSRLTVTCTLQSST